MNLGEKREEGIQVKVIGRTSMDGGLVSLQGWGGQGRQQEGVNLCAAGLAWWHLLVCLGGWEMGDGSLHRVDPSLGHTCLYLSNKYIKTGVTVVIGISFLCK